MATLTIGLLLFLGVHSLAIINIDWRNQQVSKLGIWAWKGIYSLLAGIGLILVIIGYGQARLEPHWLYQAPTGLRHLSLLLMLPVFPLALAGYLPGRINGWLKHPMLIATLLWASSHLLSNGGLHDLLLFGSILVWAALDLLSLRHRSQRPLLMRSASSWNDAIAVIAGVGLYLLFIAGRHPWLIGVTPL